MSRGRDEEEDRKEYAAAADLLSRAILRRDDEDLWRPLGDPPRYYVQWAYTEAKYEAKRARKLANELVWQTRDLEGALDLARKGARL